MDYEKAFKEAYERASLRFGTNVANELFLEYKESKEERTRRKLIEFFSDWSKTKSHCWGIRVTDIMDWLEKQGEKNLINFDEAEQEKADFVGDGFIECHADYLDFKEGNTYWLEYIGDDKYNVRSDNLLGKTYHITPCQLYTIFKKLTWLEKQGQKPAWTEADDEELENTINALKGAGKHGSFDWLSTVKWLLTIKQRIGG